MPGVCSDTFAIWMGIENIAICFYTDPQFIEEMMEYMTEYYIKMMKCAVEEVDIDCGIWWEDMCYNKGSLISPDFFKQYMVPRYKRIVSLLAKNGIRINYLDCDGKIDELVPLWLESGINCMFPLEAAHTDALALREKYGKELLLFGAVDKLALIKGRKTIDAEINRIAKLLDQGGYIPCVDHRVPPDVSFDNYRYYLDKKWKLIGKA